MAKVAKTSPGYVAVPVRERETSANILRNVGSHRLHLRPSRLPQCLCARSPPAVTIGAPPGGALTVLIVEDNAPLRNVLRHVLSSHAVVVWAASVDDALDLLSRIPIDVVLSDYQLGTHDRTGLTILRAARTTIPQARRLLMSGAPPASEHLEEGLCHAVLAKPFPLEVLLASLFPG